MKTQGIFRLSGAKPDVDRLKKAYNNGERPAMQTEDPHAVTGILKQYLRELPDPLCTFALYQDWLKAVQSPTAIDSLSACVAALPPINQAVIKVLSEFLWEVAQFESVNMMGFQNLAIVFGPTILRSREETFETISNSGLVCQVAQVLIERSATIFAKIPLPKSAAGILGSSGDAGPPPPSTTPVGPPPPTGMPAGPPPPNFMPMGPPPPGGNPPPPGTNPPPPGTNPPPPGGNPPPPQTNPGPPPMMLPVPDASDDGRSVSPPRPAFQLPPVLPKLRPVVPPKPGDSPPLGAGGPPVGGQPPVPTSGTPPPSGNPTPPPPTGVKIAIPLPGKRPPGPPPNQPPAPAPAPAPTPADQGDEHSSPSLPVTQNQSPALRPLQGSGSSPSINTGAPMGGVPKGFVPNPGTLRRSMPPQASVELDSGDEPLPPPKAAGAPPPTPAKNAGGPPRTTASVDSNAPEARLTSLEERMSRLEALQVEQKTMLELILQKLQSQ